MKKFIYSIVLLLVCMISFNNVSAQIASSTAPTEPAGSNQPDVYISNVHIETEPKKLGHNINGSFLMDNLSNSPISALYYKLYLVGDYDASGVPQTVYDELKYSPVFLGAKDSVYQRFSYNLPATLPTNDLGIMIQAYLPDDAQLGFDIERIVTQGDIQVDKLQIISATLALNGDRFALEAGPTLYENDVAALEINLSGGEDITIFPKIEVYRQSDPSNLLTLDNLEAINITKNSSKIFTEKLPVFEEGGVYVGTLRFLDQTGSMHGGLTKFRYIQSGSAGSITSITSNVTSAQKGETINLQTSFVGVPLDIVKLTRPLQGNADLDIALFNELDQNVGRSRQVIDLDDINTSAQTSLQIQFASKALRAEAKILKEGKLIATFETDLSPDYTELKAASANKSKPIINDKLLFLILGLATVIAALVAITVALWKKKQVVAAIIICIGLVGAAGIAYAQTSPSLEKSNSSSEGFAPPNVSVNVPTGMLPNQVFNATVNVTSWACNNRTSNIDTEVIFNGQRQTITQRSNSIMTEQSKNNHVIFPLNNSSTFEFTAPSTPGTYLFYVASREIFLREGKYEGGSWTVKHYNIVVTGSNADKCPNIRGLQGKIPRNLYKDPSTGRCLANDICPNIDGIQKEIPAGNIVSGGLCVLDNGLNKADTGVDDSGVTDDNNGNNGNGGVNSCDIYANWQCSAWSACVNGTKSRSCAHECSDKAVKSRPSESLSCTINTTNGGGVVDSSLAIPTISDFKAVPSLIRKGGSCNLNWKVEGATECTITGGNISGLITPVTIGSKSTGSVDVSTKYTLSCTNASSAPVTDSATCSVQDVIEH